MEALLNASQSFVYIQNRCWMHIGIYPIGWGSNPVPKNSSVKKM